MELWARGDRLASSVLCYPEGRAAIAAARRAACLTSNVCRRAVADFDASCSELYLVGIDEPLCRHAGALADELGLRGYDGVHLASALALGEDTIVVTWDNALARAALSIGCPVAGASRS